MNESQLVALIPLLMSILVVCNFLICARAERRAERRATHAPEPALKPAPEPVFGSVDYLIATQLRYKRSAAVHDAAGACGMDPDELKAHLKEHHADLFPELLK